MAELPDVAGAQRFLQLAQQTQARGGDPDPHHPAIVRRPFTPDPGVLGTKHITTTEFWMYQDEFLPRLPALHAEAARLVAEGRLVLPTASVYRAADFPEALAYFRENGKVLLDFDPHRT